MSAGRNQANLECPSQGLQPTVDGGEPMEGLEGGPGVEGLLEDPVEGLQEDQVDPQDP